MAKTFKSIKRIQEEYVCINCKQYYSKKWCKKDETPCYFCITFLPIRDTYTSILRGIDWYFLKSGEYDRESFYPEFICGLKKWGNRFHVFPNIQDLKTIEKLCEVKNWTREWWH